MKKLGAGLAIAALLLGPSLLADVVSTNPSRGGGGGISFSGPSGGTATRVLFSDTNGDLADDAGFTFDATGDTLTLLGNVNAEDLALEDSDASHRLVITTTSDLTANRNLTLVPGDAARTVTIFGDTTLPVFGQNITFAGPTAARTYTLTDQNASFAYLNVANTYTQSATWTLANAQVSLNATSGNAYLTLNNTGFPGLTYNKTFTPDSAALNSGNAVANSWHLIEGADDAFDFNNGPCGTGACTNPQFIVHDKDQNVTNYQSLGVSGVTGKFVVTLTESAATSVLTVPVADNTSVAGSLHAKVFASDGTDHQARYAELHYVAVNEADTETCTLSGSDQTDDGNISAITTGTLTYAWACSAGTNTVTITLNAVSSLTQTTLSLEGMNIHVGAGEPLPQ